MQKTIKEKTENSLQIEFIGEDEIETTFIINDEVMFTLSEKEAVELANTIMNQYYGL